MQRDPFNLFLPVKLIQLINQDKNSLKGFTKLRVNIHFKIKSYFLKTMIWKLLATLFLVWIFGSTLLEDLMKPAVQVDKKFLSMAVSILVSLMVGGLKVIMARMDGSLETEENMKIRIFKIPLMQSVSTTH